MASTHTVEEEVSKASHRMGTARLGSGMPGFCPHSLPSYHFHHPTYLPYFVYPEMGTVCQNTKMLNTKRIGIELKTSK